MAKSLTAGILAALVAFTLAMPSPADAQVDKIKRAAQKEADKALDNLLEDAVRCGLGDRDCVDKAKKDGQPVVIVDGDGNVITDEDGNPVTDPDEAERRAQKPGDGVWRNYDYTPGKVVLRATDFADEPVGRFPVSQLEYVKGNMQIVELNGVKVLEASGNSVFRVALSEELQEDFRLEFLLQVGTPNMATRVFFEPFEGAYARYEAQYLHLDGRPGIYFQSQPVSNIDGARRLADEMTPVRFQVDGEYAILYIGTERAANIPNAKFLKSNVIEFQLGGNRNYQTYITDITAAVGLDKLYDALMEEGEYTTRGIYFDLDSDAIRPESTPTLDEILETLDSHPELKLAIEGHTDSTGEADYNQELSERRAQSVVQYLVSHGVDAERLQAVGRGESDAVADNETPEGRQQNRRVVIKLASE
jgi:outer membrane protein OmpA-like peptidoglycan-associated protein